MFFATGRRIAITVAMLGGTLLLGLPSRTEAGVPVYGLVAAPHHPHPVVVHHPMPPGHHHGHVVPVLPPVRIGIPYSYQVPRPAVRYGSYFDQASAYRVAAAVGGFVRGPNLWRVTPYGTRIYVWYVYYRP